MDLVAADMQDIGNVPEDNGAVKSVELLGSKVRVAKFDINICIVFDC